MCIPKALKEVNNSMRKEIQTPSSSNKKRGTYVTYSPKDRTDIGKFCAKKDLPKQLENAKNNFTH